MDIGTALVGGAIGLISGVVTAYAAMRFRLREERARWSKELALKYASARAEGGPLADNLAKQFGSYLLIVRRSDNERQKHFLLTGARLVIGRDPASDIVISDPVSSKSHAAIESRESGAFVMDLRTGNGTFVNGVRIAESTRLESADVVTIGRTHITFVQL